MKAFLINLLLSRGLAKGSELVGKGVRHVMTFAGGWLMAQEFFTVTDGDLLSIEGALVTIGGILLSGVRTFVAKYA